MRLLPALAAAATAAAVCAIVAAPTPANALGFFAAPDEAPSSLAVNEDRELLFKGSNGQGKSKLLPYINSSSVCGLPMQAKYKKTVTAGFKATIQFKLVNNVAHDFSSVVVKLMLPEGTKFSKGAASGTGGNAKYPAVEQAGTEVVWRQVHMKAGQKRRFKVQVSILCDAPTPLVFRPYTTVGGQGWITGPVGTVRVKPTRKCGVINRGPIDVNVNVPTLSNTPTAAPPGVWTSGSPNNLNSAQSIVALPSSRRALSGEPNRELVASGYPYSLRQQTNNNPSIATAGVYYEKYGICDGLLFKDFVLGGFNFYYNFFVDSAPVTTYAPNLRIVTRSPATGQYSDFIWDPTINGQTNYQNWVLSSMNQNTGSTDPWPNGPSGGTGWGCTLGCYVSGNSTAGATEKRSLSTIVESLLQFDKCSSTYCAINDAIVTGIEIVLGPDEPNTVAFTREVGFQAGDCSYKWTFGSS